ncbi:MAG: methyltransferase domain-containing protein [Patescibacteria group bacterium]|nr:methyltransferase domain-containing protein [Patescibacteria group bacterium]
MIAFKSLQLDDYAVYGIAEAEACVQEHAARKSGIAIDEHHMHRYWEWGIARWWIKQTSLDKGQPVRVLDVGAGKTGFTALCVGLPEVASWTEVEPSASHNVARNDQVYAAAGGTWKKARRFALDAKGALDLKEQFDVVCCLSVLEHIAVQDAAAAWDALPKLVAPGGRVIVTTDVTSLFAPIAPRDGWRPFNGMWEFYAAMNEWPSAGLKLAGERDMRYHGELVEWDGHKYSFAVAVWEKSDVESL